MQECGCVGKKKMGEVVRQEFRSITSGMGKVKKGERAHEILANNLLLGP